MSDPEAEPEAGAAAALAERLAELAPTLFGSAAEIDPDDFPTDRCSTCGRPISDPPHEWRPKLAGGYWECPEDREPIEVTDFAGNVYVLWWAPALGTWVTIPED